MRSVWALGVGTALLWMGSCTSSSDDDGDGASGSAGEAGAGRPEGGSGGSAGTGLGGEAAGGTSAGAGAGGAGGDDPCDCTGDVSSPDPHLECTMPLESFCYANEPFWCTTELSEALYLAEGRCPFLETYGTRSDCADGTTELVLVESGIDATHRLVFDESGTLIGRHFAGAAYGALAHGTCHEEPDYDFYEYKAGVLPERACETTCDICDSGAGGAPTCGAGGQAGN